MARKRPAARANGKTPSLRITLRGTKTEILASILRGSVWFFCVAAIIVIPILNISSISSPFVFPKYILVLSLSVIMLTLYLFSLLLREKPTIIRSPILTIATLLFFTYMLSTIFSTSPLTSIMGNHGSWIYSLIGITAIFLIFTVMTQIIRGRSHVMIILWSMTVSGIVTASVHLADTIFFKGNTPQMFEPTVLFSTPSELTLFLVICAGCAFSIVLLSREKVLRATTLLISLILLCTSFFLGNPLIALLGGTCIIFISLYKAMPKSRTRTALLSAIGLLMALFIITPLIALPIEARILTDPAYLRGQIAIALKIFVSRPLTGTGPEIYYAHTYEHITDAILSTNYWDRPLLQPPGLILLSLSATGLTSTLFLGILFLRTVTAVLNSVRKSQLISWSLVSICFLWLIIHTLNSPSITTLFTGSVLFAAAAANSKATSITSFKIPGRTVMFLLVALVAIIVSSQIASYGMAENYYSSAISGRSQEPLTDITQATELNPFEPEYRRVRSELLTNYVLENPTADNTQDTLRQIRGEHEIMQKMNPKDAKNYSTAAENLNSLGIVLDNQYLQLSAVSQASTAIQISPNDPSLYTLRGVIFLNTGSYENARSDFDTAIKLKDDFWLAYIYASDAAVYQDDTDAAINYLNTIVRNSASLEFISLANQRLTEIAGQ